MPAARKPKASTSVAPDPASESTVALPPVDTDGEPTPDLASSDPASAPSLPPLDPETGVVGTHNAPHGLAALTGFFAKVVHGDHQGRYGVVQGADKVGKDGIPTSVALRTRDADDEILHVHYDDLERADAGGR